MSYTPTLGSKRVYTISNTWDPKLSNNNSNDINVKECDEANNECCDVAVAQINYPCLNKQDSIEQGVHPTRKF